MTPEMPEEVLERIRSALRGGRRIEAVRLYRAHTGAGLRAATEFVTALGAESRTGVAGGSGEEPASGRPPRPAGWLFVAAGTLFALYGLSEVVPPLFAPSGTVEGRVVREEQVEGPVAVFAYEIDGKGYTGRQHHAVVRHRVGEVVPVAYQAADPGVAAIDSFFDRWFIPALFAGVGTIFAGLGAVWVCKSPADVGAPS